MSIRAPAQRLRWQHSDPWLLLATLAITGLGIALVTSATWKYPDQPSLAANSWFLKQAAFAAIGLVAMVACAAMRPGVLRMLAYPLYAGSLVFLVVVLLRGHGLQEFGAQRWIEVAGIPIQPSEPAK